MGPVIVLDKSSLQSLSQAEVVVLNNYYLVNTAPVLLVEILGDLKKPSRKNRISQEQVVYLSNKLLQKDSAINMHYLSLVESSLLGREINMSMRPVLGGGVYTVDSEGKKGVHFKESPEEKAVHRWRVGEFTEAEKLLSERWRQSTRAVDLEGFQRHLKNVFPDAKSIDSLGELIGFVDALLSNVAIQKDLLMLLFYCLPVNQGLAPVAFLRWEQGRYSTIEKFAPYACFCFRAFLFFMFGLRHNLVGTRRTNTIDLEYLYYLPFCMVFSSNDAFHRQIVPFFLGGEQSFVSGVDLKSDLARIRERFGEASGGGDLHPPELADSVTNEFWRRYMRPRSDRMRSVLDDMDEDERQRLLQRLKQYTEGRVGPSHQFDEEGIEFVVRERTIRITDPCPCGSGKMFKDCHMPPPPDGGEDPPPPGSA